MKDPSGTNQELIEESSALKQRIKELEQSESELKRASEALRGSEEYFKAIIQNSSDIILIVDKLGAITYASPSTERFLGYGPDELIGKRCLDLIVSDDKPRAIADFGMALQTKEVSIPNVFRIRHKDGTERILEGIGNNLLDNPVVAGFVMNIRDITEDKKTEEREKETTHRLKILFESNPTGLLLVNARTRVITSANPTALHIMDYSNEEVIGQVCHKFVCTAELHCCPILDKGQSVDRSERMLIAKNNKQVPIIKTVVQVNINNELYLLESFIDVTERKRAEEALRESEARYRAVGQSASDAIITVNGDGTIMGWNVSAGRMFGYPEAEILFHCRQQYAGRSYLRGLYGLVGFDPLRGEDQYVLFGEAPIAFSVLEHAGAIVQSMAGPHRKNVPSLA
jgi:PAS domain S-box-containing protein